MKRCTFSILTGIFLLFLFGTQTVWAGLGYDENSVNADHESFNGSGHDVTDNGHCRVHTLTVENEVTVKEYVSYGGVVFAVSWRGGSAPPDLSTLLGNRYAEFQNQKMPVTKGRGLSSVSTDHVVVQLGGHMRAVQGRAWIPDLVPSGMNTNDIQ